MQCFIIVYIVVVVESSKVPGALLAPVCLIPPSLLLPIFYNILKNI